jgi:hypothetical protein
MSWPESVDAALCFGWIDGVRVLKAEGRMREAGLKAYSHRRDKKPKIYAYEQKKTATLERSEESSYVKDLAHRNLVTPGKRHSLDFRSVRLMSRQVAAGSRLVAVLSILKEPEREINYGTGHEVIDESIADAKMPLRMAWFASSYLDLPVYK